MFFLQSETAVELGLGNGRIKGLQLPVQFRQAVFCHFSQRHTGFDGPEEIVDRFLHFGLLGLEARQLVLLLILTQVAVPHIVGDVLDYFIIHYQLLGFGQHERL